jgi:hypothetical protein
MINGLVRVNRTAEDVNVGCGMAVAVSTLVDDRQYVSTSVSVSSDLAIEMRCRFGVEEA